MRTYRQSKFISYFVKITGFPPAWLFLKPKFYYESKTSGKLPKPCILASNHISLIDMPLYWMRFFGTNMRFLVAEVMFNKNAFMNALLYRTGCIHVDRNVFDFSFIEDAVDALDRGESIGIFPSSRLPVDGKPFPFKPSVAIIALHSDAPIVPCYTDGNYGFKKRAHVMIGDPVTVADLLGDRENELTEEQKISIITENLEKRVYALGDELKKKLNKEG